MTLTDRFILEVDSIGDADGVGVFEIKGDMELTNSLDRSFLVAGRGQYITRAIDILPEEITAPLQDDIDFDRRQGYHIDGGGGTHSRSLTGTRAEDEDRRWGDGSASGGEPTEYDAQGCGVFSQIDIFEHWMAETRSDSGGQTRLYLGEHCDGTYADEAGVYGEPVTVAIHDHTVEKDKRSSSQFEVSLTIQPTAELPDVDGILEDIDEGIENAEDGITGWLSSNVPDI